jgi:hypothetical protein
MLATRLAILLLATATLLSAQAIPAGTALPVMISSGLNAKNAKPGAKIEGKLMQEIDLPNGAQIKQGAHVTGHVVSVAKPEASGAHLVVQFDQLADDKRVFPLHAGLRAIASSQSVFQAGLPVDTNSTYESSTSWVTKQIGGEVVFRGRGYIASDVGKVGTWTGAGTWGKLPASGDCPAADNGSPLQSLWIFSTTACGAYGFEHTRVEQSGLSAPLNQIGFASEKDIDIRGGSGWLLVVNPAP